MKVVRHVGRKEFDYLLDSSIQVSSINSELELYSRLLDSFESAKEKNEFERDTKIKELNSEIELLDKKLKAWANY